MATSDSPLNVPNVTLAVARGTGAVSGNWQLAADEYVPSRFPLQWVNPNGNEGTRSAYNYTHSQFNYERVVTVTGGSPPYHFDLVSAVAGVTITKKAPAWNPGLYLWADLVINPAQYTSGTSFTIRCTDQEGTVLTLAMSVTEDDSKFVFMDSVNGSSGNTGTLASPYADLGDIYTASDADTSHQDKLVIARAGSYTIDNFDSGNSALPINSNKPVGWIPYPGESIAFSVSSNVVVGAPIGSFSDMYFGKADYLGGDTTIANLRVFAMIANHDRIVWDRPHFKNTPLGTAGTSDNPACIYAADATLKHKNISIVDISATNLTTGQAVHDFYAVEGFVVAGGTLTDSDVNNGFYCKGANTRGLVAGIDAWSNTTGRGLFVCQQGDAGLLDPIGVVQYLGCKGFKSTDGINGTYPVAVGDSNQQWGNVFMDRITLVGKQGVFGARGQSTIFKSIIINDDAEISEFFTNTAGNLADTRANAPNYHNASGDVLIDRSDYGEVGANFIDGGA